MRAPSSAPSDCDAVILCGGQGTRLRSVVNDRPKPMAMIDDRPFLGFVVEHLVNAGFHRLIFCTGYKGEWIENYFQGSTRYDALFSRETESLGTAGALKQCRPLLQTSTCLVLNGDSYCPLDLPALVKAHCDEQVPITLALTAADGRSDGGSVRLNGCGRVVGFFEKGTAAPYLNAGTYACEREFLDSLPDHRPCSLEYEVFPAMIPKGIGGFVIHAPLYDIGTPDRLMAFRTTIHNGLIHSLGGAHRC